MGKYDQIINLDRPFDSKHPAMSIHNRAAQFAPFDALTGFGGRIHEVSRLTDARIELWYLFLYSGCSKNFIIWRISSSMSNRSHISNFTILA